MVRSYFANDVNPLGSGYMEASLMQYLDLFLVSNMCLIGGFEDGASARYVHINFAFLPAWNLKKCAGTTRVIVNRSIAIGKPIIYVSLNYR